jgi:membrane carboxypeptidase/penicillin-binding protein
LFRGKPRGIKPQEIKNFLKIKIVILQVRFLRKLPSGRTAGMKIITISLYFISTIFLITCAASGAFFFALSHQVVDFSSLWDDAIKKPSIVLDDHGNEWARFALDKRKPVSYQQLPPHLINAFIAAEDWQFFNHAGISFKGIMRALWVNLR